MVRDIAVATAAGTIATLPMSLVSAQAVQIRASLHFGTAALGLATALYFLGAAVGSVPLSRVSERVGGIRVMRVSAAVCAAVLALQATVATTWLGLTALLVCGGAASSAIQPAINLFLARRMPAGRQGLAFGIKQAAIPLAALVAGLAVPSIALTVGWRWAFGVAAVLAMGAGLAVPRPTTSLAARRRQRPGRGDPVPVRALLVLTVGFGLGISAATGLWSFLVTAGVADGLAKGTAGVVAALAGGASMLMRIGIGAIADRRGRGHFQLVALLMLAGVAGYAMLSVSFAAHQTWLFTAGAIIALGAGWGFNGLFNFAVVRAHMHAPARATGLTSVGGRLGGVAGPLTVGLVIAHVSYTAAWGLDAGLALAAAGTVGYGRRLLMRHRLAAARPAGGAAVAVVAEEG